MASTRDPDGSTAADASIGIVEVERFFARVRFEM
jgi:hypothetical protein